MSVQWFKHFVTRMNLSAKRPALLIMDGHKTHNESGGNQSGLWTSRYVTATSQPMAAAPHVWFTETSEKDFYAQEIQNWLRCHPVPIVTMYQIGELFWAAYLQAATPQTAVHDFLSTEICLSSQKTTVTSWPLHCWKSMVHFKATVYHYFHMTVTMMANVTGLWTTTLNCNASSAPKKTVYRCDKLACWLLLNM